MAEPRLSTDELINMARVLRDDLQLKVDELHFFVDQLRHYLDQDVEGEADDVEHA